jgi:hypothetical protein
MKIFSKIILLCALLASITHTSCNFLDVDRYFEDTFSQDSIFSSRRHAEGYLWNTPKDFPDAGAIWGNSWNPGTLGSDEMTARWRSGQFPGIQYTIGEVNERNLPASFNIWNAMYRIIRRCNIMLAEIDKIPDMTTMQKQEYRSYVHFMRGYAYYHLLMNWGPLLIVGDEVITNSQSAEYYNRERATYDESLAYIVNEFELAAAAMPLPEAQTIAFFERPTRGAALALIARLRLIHASPLFNGGDAARRSFGTWRRASDNAFYVAQTPDPRRWAIAAAAAKTVIDMNYYTLHTVLLEPANPFYPLAPNVPTAQFPNGAGGIDPIASFHTMFNGESPMQVNREFIWVQPSANVLSYTQHSFPVTFGGWGSMSVPQRVVDAFLMNDGRTFEEASLIDATLSDLTETIGANKMLGTYQLRGNVPKMYDNRDARFYASIGFPGRFWPMRSASTGSGTSNVQIWYYNGSGTGPADTGQNPDDYTVTGYVPVKYIHPDDSWASGVTGVFRVGPKPFPIIRYAEVLLMYAEALNNVEGSETVSILTHYGQTETITVTRDVNEIARYFNLVRFRAGLPGATGAQLASRDNFQRVVMNERQTELFNEGHRYFDTRRWGIYLDQDTRGDHWMGLNVTQTVANGFWNIVPTGIVQRNIRDRVARPRMTLLPLPHSELLRVPKMDQNPGWDR